MDPIAAFSYHNTPKGYECKECHVTGVKLWREYNTFLEHQTLLCAKCACKREKVDGPLDAEGFRAGLHGMRTDQIGWMIPAVPTEDGETFWGYTSVPSDGVAWWRKLPTYQT